MKTSLYKRGETWYLRTTGGGKDSRRSLGTKSLIEAMRFMEEVEAPKGLTPFSALVEDLCNQKALTTSKQHLSDLRATSMEWQLLRGAPPSQIPGLHLQAAQADRVG